MRTEFFTLASRMLCVLLFSLALPAIAQEGVATPLVDDPALEKRVFDLSYKLRCLVCQNESIAESNAPLAQDLRGQVREQLAAGKNEDEVVSYLVDRYGDFVLYQPPFRMSTLFLWLGPVVLLLLGVVLLLRLLKKRTKMAPVALTEAERAKAQAMLENTDSDKEQP